MFLKNWKKEIFSIPNLLSFFRLILIPVYIVLYLNAKNPVDYYLAGSILAVSCLTDLLDGQIARRFHMITNFGKVLDPLADKLTQFALIFCLALRYHFLWYIVAIFSVKELFQLVAGSYSFVQKGIMLKGALLSGKICTTILFLSLIVLVIFPSLNIAVVKIIAIIDALFLLVAFADYLITYVARTSKFQSIATDLYSDSNQPK